ncbi:MAG: glycoside hydrolase family 9 protein [Deltaproteobacteria bacterium]|nr:glycoside hydrolase family 9 protein [Deltaproteobacteria bacterium]
MLIICLLGASGCSSGEINQSDAGPDAQIDAGGDEGVDAGDDAGVDAGDDGGVDAGQDAGQDAGDDDTAPFEIDGVIRLNHFGWRTTDRKVAIVLGYPNQSWELRSSGDNGLVASYQSSGLSSDEDSNDQVSTVDFSAHTQPGDYYLALPAQDIRSYDFRIADDVYNLVGAVAMKSFYFQRCNHDRALPYAGDALAGHLGRGAEWVDGACHLEDLQVGPGPGSTDLGQLDLRGGWHDAGDYQKTLWGRGLPEMLWAYELNPTAWPDDQLNIPESGNGLSDLLDELAWELDFYLRLQRPDGHFMSSVKGRDASVMSPASASDENRVYFDCTSPSGNGWSGGGVTLVAASSNAILSLAHAAIVFRAAGAQTKGDAYAQAAIDGWAWLNNASTSDDRERRLKTAAAAAVYRLDSNQASALAHAEGFGWASWDDLLPFNATPAEAIIGTGAWHLLANPAVAQPLKDTVGAAAQQVYVDRAFTQAGAYGGMFGGPGDGWDWSWGSNRAQSSYGAHLMMCAHFGLLSGHSAQELRDQAQKYLHFILGLNPLNMVYLSNMAAYGGEHSSFQIYHAWFSYFGNDGDNGNPLYNGKPGGVEEPLYPYYPDDDALSTHGPAPGLLVGGPNFYYGCSYDIPNRQNPPYAYRDFSTSCDWDGNQCLACAWEITEPMAAYQGPFVLLVSFFMDQN